LIDRPQRVNAVTPRGVDVCVRWKTVIEFNDRHAVRQCPRGAVSAYNLVHRFWGPLALGVAAAFAIVPIGFLVGALTWAFRVALDRALGYGLRTRDGFQRP
jgi:hypothetical protein